MTSLDEFTAFAHTLADAAAAEIVPLFRTPMAVECKADDSPVTAADRNAEEVMRGMILERYPDHGIWGEEYGEHQLEAEYCWTLDPVDGTHSFISGFPTFATLISLVKSGSPILGIINQPITRERWVGMSGEASTLNGKAISTRSCPRLQLASFSTTASELFDKEDKKKFDRVYKQVRLIKYGYDCYAYASLATGFIDLVVEAQLKPHDFCALAPVIEGAGGTITDWHGRPLTLFSDGRVAAAGDRRAHEQALELLAGQ